MNDAVTEALWEQVLRLLERRAHTERELRRKLLQRGYPRAACDAAIEKAVRLHLMGNEDHMAVRYAEELRSKPRSTPMWVRSKLRARGFSDSDADAAVAQAFDGWDPAADVRALLESEQDLDRAGRRLLRRGYPADAVRRGIESLRGHRRRSGVDETP